MNDQAGPLLEMCLAAQERHQEYAQPKTLTVAAERLMEYALAEGAPLLHAATPLAERVVGASIALAGGQLEGASMQPGDGRDVLVVDVAVAGPFAVWSEAAMVLAAGVSGVRCVVLDPLLHDGSPQFAALAGDIEVLSVD